MEALTVTNADPMTTCATHHLLTTSAGGPAAFFDQSPACLVPGGALGVSDSWDGKAGATPASDECCAAAVQHGVDRHAQGKGASVRGHSGLRSIGSPTHPPPVSGRAGRGPFRCTELELDRVGRVRFVTRAPNPPENALISGKLASYVARRTAGTPPVPRNPASEGRGCG